MNLIPVKLKLSTKKGLVYILKNLELCSEAVKYKFFDRGQIVEVGKNLDIQAAHVLKKIYEIKKGTSREMISREFLEYYCRIKDVDIDSILILNGALQRIKRETDMSKKK
ncbi:hypothetical protein CSC2_06280 [Clostridium zeae]|uniref:Uncharacterized protein n=1 Tax=Clostridium zeae TaxID=2759022 RepID=A0ABQ1E5S5_9CLOT|nr:hypothetical protein [Clostridium zeae]GFZ30102.1 hypothetical protein CSC2_06280 [Clostridium zeae]